MPPAQLELSPGTRRLLIIALMGFVALSAWRLGTPPPDTTERARSETTLRGATMGTTYSVKLGRELDAKGRRTAEQAIADALAGVDRTASTYRADSELSRLNAHGADTPFRASADLRELIRIALDVGERSAGALDVTVGAIVNAWGFGPDDPPAPNAAQLAELKARSGMDKLTLRGGQLRKADSRLTCDLSSIAKGFAADRVAETLASHGFQDFLVEVGGELRAQGLRSDGRPFRVGVERPLLGRREVARVVELSDLGMATSGDYRNFREHDGKRISHLIDPRTAHPVAHNLASVTILHARAAYADAWATALSVLGPVEGRRVAEREGLAALFILRKGRGGFESIETPAFSRHIQATTP